MRHVRAVEVVLAPMKTRALSIALVAMVMAPLIVVPSAHQPGDIARLKALFANPTAEYSSAPLWVWNDDLTDEMVVSTLRDLASQGVKQAFVHPRPGLMTPYLSPEWFRLWKVALKEAERLDMKLWIYDENSYPSGFAGGFVPEAMPESRGRGLVLQELTAAPAWSADALAVFDVSGPALRGPVRGRPCGRSDCRPARTWPPRSLAPSRAPGTAGSPTWTCSTRA